jgi:hypothetical protein
MSSAIYQRSFRYETLRGEGDIKEKTKKDAGRNVSYQEQIPFWIEDFTPPFTAD